MRYHLSPYLLSYCTQVGARRTSRGEGNLIDSFGARSAVVTISTCSVLHAVGTQADEVGPRPHMCIVATTVAKLSPWQLVENWSPLVTVQSLLLRRTCYNGTSSACPLNATSHFAHDDAETRSTGKNDYTRFLSIINFPAVFFLLCSYHGRLHRKNSPN